MNQRLCLRSSRILAAGCLAASLVGELLPGVGLLHAQTAGVSPRRRVTTQPLNGPNVTNESDMAAGAMLDSLFSPIAPVDPLPQATTRALGVQPSKASQRSQWAATLARNPKAADGNPPYVLIDRYGGIQRYVEPSPTVDLESQIGKTVAVRRDTGHTLLATQLELPRAARRSSTLDADVRLAAMDEPLPPVEPTPATGEPAEPIAAPEKAEIIEGQGEFIEGDGPMLDSNGQPMMMHEGHEGYEEVDPLYVGESPEFDACTTCGSSVCGMAGGCGFGSRPIWYVRGEYLLWWFDGMDTPPLVVESDNADFSSPRLIYGDEEILDESRDGARLIVGYWADDYGKWGIEGDYFGFSRISSTFIAGDPDNTQTPPPYIGRPFFNVFPFDNDGVGGTPDLPRGLALEEVETDGISGTVAVTAESTFRSAGVRLRHNLCCIPGCSTGCGDAVGCGSMVGDPGMCGSCVGASPCGTLLGKGTRRTDVMFGVRWSELDERLGIEENLRDIDGADAGSTFRVRDDFETNNQFVGGELGFLWEWMHRRWSIELLSKLAIGNTQQKVHIRGSTLFDGTSLDETGGLLAQRSNIGDYDRDQFSAIPEVGVTLGYLLTERLRFTAGYTLLYWSNVVRPGDQIDFDVNGTLIPRFTGAPIEQNPISLDNPRFDFRQTDLWAQGLNFGLDYRY